MKKIMTLLPALVLMMTGCSLIKDAAEVTISTDLTTTIPVVVTGEKSADAQATEITFSQAQDLKLADNADIEPYLEKIREINLKSLVVTVNGLTSGQAINTIWLDVTGIGNICPLRSTEGVDSIMPDKLLHLPIIQLKQCDPKRRNTFFTPAFSFFCRCAAVESGKGFLHLVPCHTYC